MIDRRIGCRVQGFALLWAALAIAGCGSQPAPVSDPPERIVLLIIDTLRRDRVPPYSKDAVAPHLETLLRDGQAFPHYRSAYHQTTMSMSALFTGFTPSLDRGATRENLGVSGRTWCGLLRMSDRVEPDECIPRNVVTLAEKLRDAGYETLGVTTNELLFEPGGYARGFDQWREVPGEPPTASLGNVGLRQVLAQRRSDRFFLYHHFMDVHDFNRLGLSYADAVTQADRGVGEMLHILENEGLREGTVFIITSDHGERLGEQHFTEGTPGHNGNPSFETLLEVPLIVSPAVFDDVERPLRTDDLHRRILALADAEDGPEPVLADDELYVSELEYQTLRDGSFKLFRRREDGEVSLIDLAADPGETRDVADEHADVAARLTARIDALAKELGDPEAPIYELSEEDKERLRALGYIRLERLGERGREAAKERD